MNAPLPRHLRPVRDASEIRAGWALFVKNCRCCGRLHGHVVLSIVPAAKSVVGPCDCGAQVQFDLGEERTVCFCAAIREGRLFTLRLGDEQPRPGALARAGGVAMSASGSENAEVGGSSSAVVAPGGQPVAVFGNRTGHFCAGGR